MGRAGEHDAARLARLAEPQAALRRDCVAVSSDLVEVKGIDLKLDEPMIYKVGTPKLKEEMTNLDWMK